MKSDPDSKEKIKCLVWDLDHTLWEGVLLEDQRVQLRPEALQVIQTLDQRGTLQSIASRNDPHSALDQIRQFGLEDYFLFPQIGWNSKAISLQEIASALNIGLESVGMVDDQPFERDEVRFSFPQVRCYAADDLLGLLDLPEFQPQYVTEDGRLRRLMYQTEILRQQAEKEYQGSQEDFLRTLEMALTISPAQLRDLQRAEELTARTNQLNTTGRTYSMAELNKFRQSKDFLLLMLSMQDRYGPYGQVGLALVNCKPDLWMIKLLLMSCRVMSRGVGMILLCHILRLAKQAGVRLQIEYAPNERNRLMNITVRLAGFRDALLKPELWILEHDLAQIPPVPDYVTLHVVSSVEDERGKH